MQIQTTRSATELLGFLASFLTIGAVGFRFFVLPRAGAPGPERAGDATAFGVGARRAAVIGVAGTVLAVLALVLGIGATMAARDLTFGAAWARGGNALLVRLILLALMLLGFALAGGRVRAGWWLALAAVLAFTLRDVVRLQWKPMVLPLHLLGGSLWLGTLFVLVVAGIPAALRGDDASGGRGRRVAELVNRFSPLALVSAALLLAMGIISAVIHVKFVSALWSTSYGVTLLVKLAAVALVAALGAWNWRRMRPSLGEEQAGHAIRRSAGRELGVALVVLLITSVLVTLPVPKLPGQ